VAAVFITNAMLTQWSDQGKVRLDDTTLTLLKEARTVKLKPAVRFTKTIDDSADPNSLLGKVKTTEQLAEMGAEHYLDSVILGEVGYQVVEGFMGDLSPPPKPAAPPPEAPAPTAAAAPPAGPAPLAEPPPERPRADKPGPTAALPVDLPAPAPVEGDLESGAEESEAEALSKLFLTTVRD
jgi:hypothetical protein